MTQSYYVGSSGVPTNAINPINPVNSVNAPQCHSIIPHSGIAYHKQIRYAINPHGVDKNWDFEKLATGYQDKTGTLQDVVDHIKQGHAVCAGLLGGQRRTKANVIGSQVAMLDIDNSALLLDADGKPVKGEDGKSTKVYEPQLTLDQALTHPFIQQHCSLIYTSASHKPDWHKFRLVFLLPEFESDVAIIEAMILLLMEQLPHDAACKDASRVFYGNTKAEIPLFNPDVTLPLEWREQAIAAAADELARKEQQRKQQETRQRRYQQQVDRGEVNRQDTDALVLDALDFIPPRDPGTGNYQDCLTVLMALCDHFGEFEAERIAEQWSPSVKGTSWDISRKIRSFKRGGVGVGSLFHIAKQHGWKFPERDRPHYRHEKEPTISRDDWQRKFGITDWLKHQIEQFKHIFKKASLPNPEPKATKPAPTPKVIRYVPGDKLPTLEQYKAMGSLVIKFAPGERLQLIAELVQLGYHDILDSSPTGTSKSHDVGLAEPGRLGVDRLWYFNTDHRNPTTAPVEGNYADMPVRHNGLVEDDSRRTPSNYPHIRWPRHNEEPTTQGNCFRTGLFHTLAAKGYAETGTEAKTNPICGTCHLSDSCAGKGDVPILPGASFRNERREAFLNKRIRASLNSVPVAKELEVKVNSSEDGTEQLSNRNGAFVDEVMRQLQPTEEVQIHLSDFDQTFAELESKLPDVHEVLKPLRLALRAILAGEIKPTKETYHGWNDAAVRDALVEFREKLFSAVSENNDLIMLEIIQKIESIKPKLQEILKEPDGFNKNGAAAKDRTGISNETSAYIRSKVRQESYRDIAKELRSLPINWLIPFLEVWSGAKRGALRIDNEMLTVTTRSTRHADALKAMQWCVYLDATAARKYLAMHLDIDPLDIVQIEQEVSPVDNLTIVQVSTLGLVGHGRSNSLKARLAALKPALKQRHDDIAFLDHKEHADVGNGDGWWFNHNRGSNEYKTRSAIASLGTPYQNVGASQDLWLTLTGDRNVAKDALGFAAFVQWQTQSEITQAVGRLRANLRPDEFLTFYSCTDFDLGFLQQYYSGATIKKESAFNIVPAAGTETEQSHWRIQQRIFDFVKETGATLEKLTQVAAAKVTGLTQGRISQVAAKFGGWVEYKKLLAVLLESLYTTANNFCPLNEEQLFIAENYFPLVAEEDPPDAVGAMLTTGKAYGWKIFESILAVTSPQTRGKLVAALISGLPPDRRDELRSLLESAEVMT